MSEHSIPVDLFNPGQVFACLGFLEAAEILLGDAEGRFDWASPSGETRFHITGPFEANPFQKALESVATGALREIYPNGWPEQGVSTHEVFPSPLSVHIDDKGKPSTTKLPAALEMVGKVLPIESWTDGSSRPDFKLYSGNRSGFSIASDMAFGKRDKPKKGKTLGEVANRGIKQLLEEVRASLVTDPFNITTPMAGSFNMDPRGAWNSMDAGYSPNEHGDDVAASPVVEFFACLALEHFRPFTNDDGICSYSVWNMKLPPILARAALSGSLALPEVRRFTFQLAYSGKNKIITYAEESN